MENNFDNIERIIDYLNGDMTPPQYLAFETLISKEFKTGYLHRYGGVRIGVSF